MTAMNVGESLIIFEYNWCECASKEITHETNVGSGGTYILTDEKARFSRSCARPGDNVAASGSWNGHFFSGL